MNSRPALSACRRLRGLYAITADRDDTGRLVEEVSAALDGGASVVQYRNKRADAALRRRQAVALRMLCGARGVPLIVNDDWRLALDVDADGVHVGADDGDPRAVREAIGPDRLLGVSCYDRLELAHATDGVVDQVAFGSVFASATKPAAVRAPLSLLARAHAEGRNVIAIGGIDATNAAQAMRAGADALAVIGAVFDAGDARAVMEAAKRIVAAMKAHQV